MIIVLLLISLCVYKIVTREEKVEFLSEDNDSIFERRFRFAALRIDRGSEAWIEEALTRYDYNYFDNADAVAMLELLEEEAFNKGTHPEIRRMFNILTVKHAMDQQKKKEGLLYVCC